MAKRLIDAINQNANIPTVAYLFNEEATPLPDLGGIQATLGKRHRHRRAMMRMLFDYHQTDKMVICMDTANLDLMQDFASDRATTKILEIQCEFSDEYLIGHSSRVGLMGHQTPPDTVARLLPTVRNDFAHESDRIRDGGFEHYYRIRELVPPEDNAAAIASFLSVSDDVARTIAQTPYLYVD